jgi:hypothetical protein
VLVDEFGQVPAEFKKWIAKLLRYTLLFPLPTPSIGEGLK